VGSLRSRVARLSARIPRAEPEAPADPLDDAEWMAICRALGADHLRGLAADPEFPYAFEREIAALEREEQEEQPWPRA
jgi:hypothetical protein